MSRVFKQFDMYDIYIEPKRRIINIKQRWKYNWIDNGLGVWTYAEKKEFHDNVDKVIWQQWSGNYYAESIPLDVDTNKKSSNLEYSRKQFTINFDIEWVTSNEHWTANVNKVLSPKEFVSKVHYSTYEVFLSNHDYITTQNTRGCNLQFNIAAHEFGHMISRQGDEYGEEHMWPEQKMYLNSNPSYKKKRLRYEEDYSSRMNIGNELRNRFVFSINDSLDIMIPGIIFRAFLSSNYLNSINAKH